MTARKSTKPVKKAAAPKTVKPAPQKPKHLLARLKAWFKARHIWQRIALVAIAVVLFITLLSSTIDALWIPTKEPNYGVSFSPAYAEELGVDWHANYLALLDGLQFKRYRLMSYWDRIEKQPGQYDFSEVDWQLNEAAKRGYTVSLAIGLRQPRWPECHEPGWAKDQYAKDQAAWKASLYKFIETTVDRYKDHPAIQSYQLENEAVNSWFGICQDHERARLREEFDLVKKTDPNHPVYMSLSDQHGFPAGTPVPDKYGFSVYRVVWNDKTPWHFYVTYPTPLWYHRGRAALIGLIKHRDVFVHELQVEPWGPKPTKDLTIAEQDRSMNNKQIEENFLFARKIGKSDIYMWGAEWWYWRKTTLNDSKPWDRVKQELEQFPN
jgi:hypothetical protein